MKKITFNVLLFCAILCSFAGNAQCLTAPNGQWPTGTYTPTTCDGLTNNSITTVGYAGEYSSVNVTAGETYTFTSSLATDYITVSTDDGASAVAYGLTPVVWVSDFTGALRFYTHADAVCTDNTDSRTRSIICGIAPCVQPQVTFSKTFDCGSSTFEVTADITDLGSATSITVTDDQASPSQSVSSTGPVTFGPYPFGTNVILTATNDDTPVCNVVSAAQGITACPPANDECATAIVLNCGDVLTAQSTDGATGATTTSCVGTIGNDIWYSFEGDGQIITLTATSTNLEGPQVEVYESTDGTCAGFTPGSCFASAGTGETVVTVNFVSTVGKTYYTHIGSWISTDPAVVFDLAITCAAPPTAPANDDCAGAESLTVNPDDSCAVFASGTVAGATASSVDATSCNGTEDDDVWYSFTATDALQTIKLSNVVGSSTGMSYSVWSGDCGTLALVAGSCSSVNASTITGLTAGQTYYVRVYTTTATAFQNTTFDICIGTPPPPPANDDCTGAIEITPGGTISSFPVVGSTVSATNTTGLPTLTCVATNRSNDVWYSVVVPDSGSLTIETNPTPGTVMTDTVLTIFSGVCGSLVEVGCDDDSSTSGAFSLKALTGLTPGSTLYIGVWRYGTTLDGDFQVSAYDASLLSNSAFESGSFKSFPNPVKNVLNLSFDKNISNVAVFNLVGQEVMTKAVNANQSQIDMSHLSAGTYLVKVTADNQVKTIKVIKE